MIINPIIVAALVVQAIIGQISRMAAACVGYVITTGILVWGLSLYSAGEAIAFFGVPLSQPVFLVACLVWYGFDTTEFIAAQTPETTDAAVGSSVTEAGSEPHPAA